MPRPPIATTILLRFLDFFYAVVFATFTRNVYERLICAPPTDAGENLSLAPWANLVVANRELPFLFACSAAFFVALDWIHARLLTEKHVPYVDHWRFFLDFVIAFLSFGALQEAAQGHARAVSYIALIYALGAGWVMLCLAEDRLAERKYNHGLKMKLRTIGLSHGLGAVGFGLLVYFGFPSLASGGNSITWPAAGAFFGVFLGCLLFEIAWHVWWVPEEFWEGPTGLPFVRFAITLFVDPPESKQ